jgi:L-amino acid ligase
LEKRKYVCVVIDAYSTARLLAPSFASLGYACLHVQTLKNLSDAQIEAFRPSDFLECLRYEGDLNGLSHYLAGKYPHIKCVIPGIESAVTLADHLSDRLGLASNGAALSAARRDKVVMAKAVRASGIPVIPFLKSDDVETICAWMKREGFQTVVLKPKSSSGTFGFNICEGELEVRETFARLYRSADIFGDLIDEVLAQPLIEGQEYAVNCVSCDGQHYVTDIWRTDKSRREQSKVYEKETLIYVEAPEYEVLTRYVVDVLSALRIRFGPSHTEVMLTTDGRVLLIETAARLMGALDVSMVTEALGHNAVQLTTEAYLTPERFMQRINAPLPRVTKHASMVQMLSGSEGTLKGFAIDKLQALPSFHGVDLLLKPGDRVVPTINSYTSPGLIFLSHPDPLVVEADYRAIRDMEEKEALFMLA